MPEKCIEKFTDVPETSSEFEAFKAFKIVEGVYWPTIQDEWNRVWQKPKFEVTGKQEANHLVYSTKDFLELSWNFKLHHGTKPQNFFFTKVRNYGIVEEYKDYYRASHCKVLSIIRTSKKFTFRTVAQKEIPEDFIASYNRLYNDEIVNKLLEDVVRIWKWKKEIEQR